MNSRSILKKSCLALAVSAVTATMAHAQLEEVLVTATKREQSTQDIPMSITAVSGDRLDAMGIDNFEDLSNSIPNFTVGDTLIVNQITMRGIGSGEDRGFEQSVSTFKDGVYLPRSRQSRSPFFDVDRVEVLRGPQAVLFGLNSTAGAISVHGAVNRPGDEFELTVTGEYESEQEGYRGRAVAGGSLGDTIGWRLALETMDGGDAWLDNSYSGDAGEPEHDIARISLVWEPTDDISAIFRWEHNESELGGQMTDVAAGNISLPGDGDAGGLIARVDSMNALAEQLGMGLWDLGGENGKFDYKSNAGQDGAFNRLTKPIDAEGYRHAMGADQEIDNVSLNVDWALGEYTLSGLIGYSDYHYDAGVNIAGLAENFFYGTNYEEYEQTSFELRLASPVGGTFEWIAGVYYHDADLFTDQPNIYDVNKTIGLAQGLPEDFIEANVTNAPLYELAGADLDQNTELLSPFVAVTWNVNEAWRVKTGVRYSDEEKDYKRNGATDGSGLYLKLPDGSMGPFLGGAILNGNGAAIGKTSGNIDSDNTMPELMVEWDMSEDIMFFARYAESAKSGGVATAGSVDASGLIYDDETADSIELGMKGRFLDGRAELNATLFTTEFDDLQVKSSKVDDVTGSVVTLIGNAGKATTEGLELDGRLAVNDWLMLGGSVAWLNAEYDEYKEGPCNRSLSTKPSATAGTCDLDGEQLPFAADYSGSVYADVRYPLSGNLELVANVTVAFSDEYPVEGTLEPSLYQDSWTKLSGRIGVTTTDDKWSVTVIGQNLTEEEVWLGGQPLFGYHMAYPGNPRTITLQGVYRF